MSELQRQAVRLINGLSDDDMRFLIEIIQRLMSRKTLAYEHDRVKNTNTDKQAVKRFEASCAEIRQYLRDDFDPDRELANARAERYGSVD